MTPEEAAIVPEWMAVVEQIARRAVEAGEYPEIFEGNRLPDTLYRVIAASRMPTATIGEFRQAKDMAAYHIGQYMRFHDIELTNSALPQ